MLVVVDFDVSSNLILLCMDGELNRTRGPFGWGKGCRCRDMVRGEGRGFN